MKTEDGDLVVRLLAEAMSKTRAEIDAMRSIMIAAVATISAEPALRAGFVARLQRAKEADEAMGIASSMTDEMLLERSAWFSLLLPPDVRPLVI